MLPLLLTFSNRIKVGTKWLRTGDNISKEEVERAIKEQHQEEHLRRQIPDSQAAMNPGNQISNPLEAHTS